MVNENRFRNCPLVANKAALREILDELDLQNGFVIDPAMTPKKARELIIAKGICPEDNAFKCELLRMREGD